MAGVKGVQSAPMSTVPVTLAALARFYAAQGGTVLGIVGDSNHHTGYHLGRDRIYDGSGPGIGDADYSVRTTRDRAGLTNAASAIDLGRIDDTLTALRRFSVWFVDTCVTLRGGAYRDVREVIYSPDGRTVYRYDGTDGVVRTGPGQGDDTHLTHTHISFYRDSETRDKVPLFAPYFVVGGGPMPAITTYIPGSTATIKPTSNVRVAPTVASQSIRTVGVTGETWVVTGWVTGSVDPDGGADQWLTRWNPATGWEYTAKINVTSLVAPASATDLATANARIALIKGKTAANAADIAND